jgi:hypothetical protein
MYAFDGNSQEAVSIPVDNYWRDGIIDFSKSKYFYVKVTPQERVVRFYYCRAADGAFPTRALCFCIATRAWWEEVYAEPHASAVPAVLPTGAAILSGGNGRFLKPVIGSTDVDAASIPYELRTGNYALDAGPSRSIGVLYKPSANTVQVRAHYNGSTAPRPNAIFSERGDGFTSPQGGSGADLNMSLNRSALGTASGFSRAQYAGRLDERSAGADRHMAIAIAGAKTSQEPVTLYSISIDGVTG